MLSNDQIEQLDHFFSNTAFSSKGAVITDLDGTAVHEYQGRTIIHESVEMGLKKIHDVGRPVIINSLRFPLSVIRTFGKEWYRISNAPIPSILLNGSQLGHITKTEDSFAFEQLISFPLLRDDIQHVLKTVQQLVNGKVNDFILFYYPEDWKCGEIIWTPVEERIPYLQDKYRSASSVITGSPDRLSDYLLAKPICMIFLLIEVPQDQLMAYQHSKRSNFVTRPGVDKLSGTKQMASLLQFDLLDSLGAGDSEMDTFLQGVGLSIHVGNPSLPFNGRSTTMKLSGFPEFGNLLFRFAEMQDAVTR